MTFSDLGIFRNDINAFLNSQVMSKKKKESIKARLLFAWTQVSHNENNLNCMAEVRGMIIEISGVYYSKKGTRELSRKIDTTLRWPAKESFTIQGEQQLSES